MQSKLLGFTTERNGWVCTHPKREGRLDLRQLRYFAKVVESQKAYAELVVPFLQGG